jgi:hypothetical protein
VASKKRTAKREGSGKFGEKANFIRSLPAELSPKEVVEEAKKRGLAVTVNHVYAIRAKAAGKPAASGSRQQSEENQPTSAATPARSASNRSSTSRSASNRSSSNRSSSGASASSGGGTEALESQLRLAIANLGLVRAREVFKDVESAFRTTAQ